MYKYSILMYNFNNYEIMHEPKEIDPECEYLYITDNIKFKKQTKIWKVIVDDSLKNLSVFDKCYAVRFNLFKYATTPVCIYLDASVQINKSLRKFYNDFMQSSADIGLNIHPERTRIDYEYYVWVKCRAYPKEQAKKCLNAMHFMNYDFSYNGLYQGTCRICKNTELNNRIDMLTYNLLKLLGTNNCIERLDQNVYSFIINSLFTNIQIFPFSQQVIQSDYMTWCLHGKNKNIKWNKGNDTDEGYCLNKKVKLYKLI